MLQEDGHIKNKVVLNIQHIQCLHLMYSGVAWVLVSLETQVEPQIILNPNHPPDNLFVLKIYTEVSKIFDQINCWFISNQTYATMLYG